MLIVTLLTYVLWAFIIILLVRVAFSWVSPYPTNAVSRFAWQLTEPILVPIRHRLPPVSGIDLSPMVVMVVAFLLIGALDSIH